MLRVFLGIIAASSGFDLSNCKDTMAYHGIAQVEWIRSSMDRWSKTKSRVWYGNHILILGWGEKTLYLLNELFEALCSSGEIVPIVVMAEREPAEMYQEVQQHFYQMWEGLSFFDRHELISRKWVGNHMRNKQINKTTVETKQPNSQTESSWNKQPTKHLPGAGDSFVPCNFERASLMRATPWSVLERVMHRSFGLFRWSFSSQVLGSGILQAFDHLPHKMTPGDHHYEPRGRPTKCGSANRPSLRRQRTCWLWMPHKWLDSFSPSGPWNGGLILSPSASEVQGLCRGCVGYMQVVCHWVILVHWVIGLTYISTLAACVSSLFVLLLTFVGLYWVYTSI